MVFEKPFPFGAPAFPRRKQVFAIGSLAPGDWRRDPKIVLPVSGRRAQQSVPMPMRTFYEPVHDTWAFQVVYRLGFSPVP